MKKPENVFKQKVIKSLEVSFGDDCYILATQEKARRGVPDLICSLQGDFIAIELKCDGLKPDPLQKIILERINKSGAKAFFTTPALWENHLDILEQEYLK